MEKQVLINEIMWEYNYSRSRAEKLVDLYEKQDKSNDLWQLIKSKQDISMVIKCDV